MAGLAVMAATAWAAAPGDAASPLAPPSPPSPPSPPAAMVAPAGPTATASSPRADTRYVILAVEDRGEPLSGAGGSPRGDYRRMAGYAGSARASALSEALAREYRLHEEAAWTIAPLNLRCMLFALSGDDDVDALLARVRGDARVKLAQPLNEFETLAGGPQGVEAAMRPGASSASSGASTKPSAASASSAAAAAAPLSATSGSPYNDPYFGLQKGFQQMSAAALQQVSVGARVKVAVIDTGVDARHPDLSGQVARQRDYVSGGGALVEGVPERHGTEVMGLIAARANNRQGIVGLAPGAVITSYRACWTEARVERPGPGTARCNSFTLAQALGAAIADGADVINLSLGGPSDPLLTRLARHAQARGAVLVAAAPPERLGKGFPSEVPGALVVASAGDASEAEADGWLVAPGRAVLTTVPNGGYDMDTGSSLAAAHVTGVVALLRAADPVADAPRLRRALLGSMSATGGINACAAARTLGVSGLRCDGDTAATAAR
ncbi:S8 family peptidase [Roseateles chitinivorans]|nr:S8 family serine peptidase [Roseateles chitinivorans]